MNAITVTNAGLTLKFDQPKDVTEFIRAARYDLSGTDYPGALQLATQLAQQFDNVRESRMVAALMIVALEGGGDTGGAALDELTSYIHALSN